MEQFLILLQISIGAIFIQNFILSRFLGLCTFMGVSKKLTTAMGMGMAVMFVMTISSMFTWSINRFILEPMHLQYLQTIIFILVIASLVQLVEMILRKNSPILYDSLGVFLPLITTNCAILGVAVLLTGNNPITGSSYSFIHGTWFGLMSGVGFTLALVLMAGVREKLEFANIPEPLKGLPIAFITAGLMAIAFLGFAGMAF